MNRLSPVLYIRSTLASSRAHSQGSRTAAAGATKTGQDVTIEKLELPMPAGVSDFGSTILLVAGEDPSTPRRAQRESTSLFASCSADGPFRSTQPSGETPTHVEDDPFEGVVMESISVGLVPVCMPRLTDPIAPCTGFAMQAEVVKRESKFTEYRRAQRKALPERESRVEESERGLFFASRMRGRSPPLSTSNDGSSPDSPPPRQPRFDYLRVDIPSVSIVIPGTGGSL